MKYIFFGTPEFAAIILEKLLGAGFVPQAVVCNPDRPVGRKKIITSPPVKAGIMNQEARIKNQIKILQPENLSLLHNSLFMLHPDFFIVAAYANIIPGEMLKIPKMGAVGVHPSLLPKYRGPSPIQTAILNGEEETGVTLYLLDEKMDHGPIIENRKWKIENRTTYLELQKQLAELGGNLLVETIPKFLAGEIKPQPQNEELATYTKKFVSEDAFVDEDALKNAISGENKEGALLIERKIRALNPEPGVWTIQNGKRVKLLEAEIKDNELRLKKIQTEGKKPRPCGI